MHSELPPRSRFVFATIWLVLLLAGAVAAWKVYQRVLDGAVMNKPDDSLTLLQPFMPGEILRVPDKPGIWLLPQQHSLVIANLAEQEGGPERINLCQQRTLSKEVPDRIFPVYIGGDFADLEQLAESGAKKGKRPPRNPVVVSTKFKAGMPRLILSGRAPDEIGVSFLKLTATGGSEGGWRLLSDITAPIGDSAQDGVTVEMDRQAWLLWRNTDSVGKNSDATGEADRFDFAIRLQRGPDAGCGSGNLELSLFAVSAVKDAIGHVPMASLTVLPHEGGATTTRMPAGEYVIPAFRPPSLEDKALFDGLLASDLIHLNANGLIEVAPVDLPAALDSNMLVAGWPGVKALSDEARRLLKRFYTKADGRYVWTQVNRYNQERMWSAVRVKSDDFSGVQAMSDSRRWAATVDGKSAQVIAGMPDVAARLFNAPPEGWSEWVRVAAWPTGASGASLVRFHLRLPPKMDNSGNDALQVLALGRIVSVAGGTMSQPEPSCGGPGCPAADTLQAVRVQPLRKSESIEIVVVPDAHFHALDPEASEFRHIRLHGGKLIWVQSSSLRNTSWSKAEVGLQARDGLSLFAGGKASPAARDIGLSSLVGVSSDHEGSVAGMLARLGAHGQSQVSATLTIEPGLQSLANRVLDCVGMQGRRWLADEEKCSDLPFTNQVEGRRAGLVILDAGQGDILAVAGMPQVGEQTSPRELADFDRFNPGDSPLRIRAWQHDGGVEMAAGSTFKLITALGLEQAAMSSSAVGPLLDGMPVDAIDGFAANRGYAFSMKGMCYPMPCGGKHPIITNFRQHRPMDYAHNGRFGLQQALSSSMNTWFAWMAEQVDATLAGRPGGGMPDARPLGGDSLDSARPVFEIAHRLGFERAIMLDGGLLPKNFRWQNWDSLRATPSSFDSIGDRHQVRQHAIGLRMQITPLQLAVVAASIGEGRAFSPHLLAEMDGRKAETRTGEQLGMRLDRIRAGMKEVVENGGTAQSAFLAGPLLSLRSGVYAKTGTAPVPNGLNTAWFTGYIEPGTIPGEARRLAFAVFVSRTELTGGVHAAPVIASLLETLALRSTQDATTKLVSKHLQ